MSVVAMSDTHIDGDMQQVSAMSLSAYHANGAVGGPVASYDNFEIGLFESGNVNDCLYSYLCPLCALARARSQLDDSDYTYNLFCMGHIPERWMIRSAYGVPGSGLEDLAVASCCFPCSANQLYQTTKLRRNPTMNGGREYNKEHFARPTDSRGVVRRFCCAIFCLQCTAGAALQRGVGMPFWMGCCCMNICTARNVIRYQHRIIGNDLLDECALPALILLAAGASLLFLPLLICVAPVVVARSMQLQAQGEAMPTQTNRYLVNDSIRQIPVPVHQVEVVRPSIVPATILTSPDRTPNQQQPNVSNNVYSGLELTSMEEDGCNEPKSPSSLRGRQGSPNGSTVAVAPAAVARAVPPTSYPVATVIGEQAHQY